MAFLPAPKVNKKELKKYLSKHFNLGRVLFYRKLKKGLANCMYQIKTTKGEYAFKVAVRHNSRKLYYEIELLNEVKGLPTPKPIPTKQGDYVFDYKGHLSFIYPFLPGREKKKFTDRMLFQVGQFLGKLHLQTEGFESIIRRTDFYHLSKERIERVYKKTRHEKSRKIRDAVSYIKNHVNEYQLPVNLPTGAMHIDFKPENTLFQGEKLTGVVDFDNSYNGPLLFDLADTIAWFCSKRGKFDIKGARIVSKGYQSIRKLNKLENLSLFYAIRRVRLAITFCGVDYYVQKKLPEKYIIWVIDNLLRGEQNLKINEDEFQKKFISTG